MDTSQRAAVSFTDVAASFSEEEWDILEEWQRHLYGNVMHEIHNVLLDLGYHIENSEVLFRIVSKEVTSKCGQRQEGLGPDIILRINYQGPEVEDPEQRVIKTEPDLLPEVKQEEDLYDTGVPDTSQDERPRSTPGLVLYPVTIKEAEDGGGDSQLSDHHTSRGQCVLHSKGRIEALTTRPPYSKPTITGSQTEPGSITKDEVVLVRSSPSFLFTAPLQMKATVAAVSGRRRNGRCDTKFPSAKNLAMVRAETEGANSQWTSSKTRAPCKSRTTGDPTPDRTRRRKGIARQIKSVSALHDSDQNKQTEPKENEAPRHPRLSPECEPSFTVIKLPFPAARPVEEVYPISFQQRGQSFIICSVCGKTFCNKSSFQVHMRTHTGERPYKCTYCDKNFIRSSHLKIHLRTHTGERPYKCPGCDKSFRDNSSFARHQRIHTGEKPYQCSTCGKYFRKKSNLKDHQRTHTGERPYTCTHCDKSFHQRSNLRVHERNHHRDS